MRRPGHLLRARPAGGAREPEAKITDGLDPWALWSPAAAIDDEGSLHAIWADTRDGASGLYVAVRTAGNGWETIVQVSDLGAGNRINPTIAVDGQGNAFAVWQHFYGCAGGAVIGDIEFARQDVGAAGSAPFG